MAGEYSKEGSWGGERDGGNEAGSGGSAQIMQGQVTQVFWT